MEHCKLDRCNIPSQLQHFYYRQMMYYVLFRSAMGAVQGRSVGWRGVEPEGPAAPTAPAAPAEPATSGARPTQLG